MIRLIQEFIARLSRRNPPQMTPRARQIYKTLKAAIARRRAT